MLNRSGVGGSHVPYPEGHYTPSLAGLRIAGDDDTLWLYHWTHVLLEYLREQQDRIDALEHDVMQLKASR